MLVDFAAHSEPIWGLYQHKETQMAATANRTHGMANTPVYRVWRAMLNRCQNPKSKSYKDYGGRGIMVCWAWRLSFEAFYEDMGPRPPKHEIERKDNNGPYSPENCLWVTRWDQVKNKRNTRMLTANGRTMHLAEWARELGVGPAAILRRLKLGWSEERALTEPKPKRPNSKLTDSQVREIRAAFPSRSIIGLARDYRVDQKTIANVVYNRIFRDVEARP